MVVDPPAKVVVLGGGPIGLEAALYARFLGYRVEVLERASIADHVKQWGHVRMFSPFGMNRSPLGLAALAAQDADYDPPRDDEILTGDQWVARYLVPLSKTDLLAGCVKEHTEVVGVSRDSLLKSDMPSRSERAASPFRILARMSDGSELDVRAEVVIDATGVFGQPNWLGAGGLPAIGEIDLRDRIEYRVPDFSGKDAARFAGRKTLLVGNGYSAATCVVALAKLAREAPSTKVVWVTRREHSDGDPAPITLISNDRLAQRLELSQRANRLAAGQHEAVEYQPQTHIVSLAFDGTRFSVELASDIDGRWVGRHEFDEIIANVGFRGDSTIFSELQVHQCYATGGPMKLAAALLGQSSGDCLDQITGGPPSLLNPEPNFYILGAKSFGRNSNFLISLGLEQIRDIFTIIGGRDDLDVYKTIASDR